MISCFQLVHKGHIMAKLPPEIINAWKHREGPVVFTTVSDTGVPNSIYVTCVSLYETERIVIADNYFKKTKENLKHSRKVCILFLTDEKKAYQLTGSFRYVTEGLLFDWMKSWNPVEHPGHAAVVIEVTAAFSGSRQLL